jgi:hypothetical protein
MKKTFLFVLFALLSACSTVCNKMTEERLYFGAESPQGRITTSDWQDFLKNVVTPKFPSGLTVIEAQGQWLGNNGVIVKEPSMIVEIIHHNSYAERKAIDEIVRVYKERFQQEAVLDTISGVQACL